MSNTAETYLLTLYFIKKTTVLNDANVSHFVWIYNEIVNKFKCVYEHWVEANEWISNWKAYDAYMSTLTNKNTKEARQRTFALLCPSGKPSDGEYTTEAFYNYLKTHHSWMYNQLDRHNLISFRNSRSSSLFYGLRA